MTVPSADRVTLTWRQAGEAIPYAADGIPQAGDRIPRAGDGIPQEGAVVA